MDRNILELGRGTKGCLILILIPFFLITGIFVLIEGIAFGIIDSGNIREAQCFNEGVVWARVSNRWQLHDTTGTALLRLRRNEAPVTHFAEGVSIIRTRTGSGQNITDSYRLINKFGETIMYFDGDLHICNTHECFNVHETAASNADVSFNPVQRYGLQFQREINWGNSFSGYIVVCRKIMSYDVNITERGVIAPDGSWVQPLQEGFLEGFIFVRDGVFKKPIFNDREWVKYLYYDISEHRFSEITLPIDWATAWSDRGTPGASIMDSLKFRAGGTRLPGATHRVEPFIQGFYNRHNELVVDLSAYENISRTPYFVDGVCYLRHLGADGREYIVALDETGRVISSPHLVEDVNRIQFGRAGVANRRVYYVLSSNNGTFSLSGEFHNFTLPPVHNAVVMLRDFTDGIARAEVSRSSAGHGVTNLIREIYYVNLQGEMLNLSRMR